MLQASFSSFSNLLSLILFSVLIISWAWLRAFWVRDYDDRPLPNHAAARITFVAIWLTLYAAVVVTFHTLSEPAIEFANKLNLFGPLIKPYIAKFQLQDKSPILAFVTCGFLMQFAVIRDLERSIIVWLHSARDLKLDGRKLADYLTRNAFIPNEQETRFNRDTAAAHGLYVTDDDAAVDEKSGLVAFKNWRKVAALLRVVRSWHEEDGQTLSKDELVLLREIEASHERKTQLAIAIVKMVDQVEQGGSFARPLSAILNLISETGHVDRDGIATIEARMKSLLSEERQGGIDRPVRLTSEELNHYMTQIEGYFKVEYQTLLQQISDLAAKSVVLSGQKAPQRLERLKEIGFGGLGRIEPIDLDRILGLILFVGLGGFLVLLFGEHGQKFVPIDRLIGNNSLARFSFIMTIAALIGAMFGSSRSVANSRSTPWATFFAAGALAAFVFLAMQAISGLIKTELDDASSIFTAHRTLPWLLLPFLVTLSICRLARVPAWPGVGQFGDRQGIAERVVDGLVVSGVIYLAHALAIAIHEPLGLEVSKRVQTALAEDHFAPIPISWPLQAMGFLIGFVVVRDVRRAAHVEIIENSRRQSDASTVGHVVTRRVAAE